MHKVAICIELQRQALTGCKEQDSWNHMDGYALWGYICEGWGMVHAHDVYMGPQNRWRYSEIILTTQHSTNGIHIFANSL